MHGAVRRGPVFRHLRKRGMQDEFDRKQVKFLMVLALVIASVTVALIYQLA
jgi:hypothetical protein